MVFGTIQRLPLHQLFITTLVGVLSGVYIFKPLFFKRTNEQSDDITNKPVIIVEGKSMEPGGKV
jgi:hypothetical protein